MKIVECKTCKKEFTTKKNCKSREPKYCSKQCYAESLKINKRCKLCNSIIQNKHSASMHNRVYCSKECQSLSRKGTKFNENWKKALSEGRKKSEKCKGENLYNWKGGKETESIRVKQSFYKRKRSLKHDMPITFLGKMLIAQNNQCFYCNEKMIEYKAIEHLTPVSKNGDNEIYNLVYSCKTCNSKKRQLTLEQFAIKNKRLDLLNKWETLFLQCV
jgi:hypothetical protein